MQGLDRMVNPHFPLSGTFAEKSPDLSGGVVLIQTDHKRDRAKSNPPSSFLSMTAPPARPHILPRQTSSFLWGRSESSSNDWSWSETLEDDDTWDSGSDHEEDWGKKGTSNRIGSGLKVGGGRGSKGADFESTTSSLASSAVTSSSPAPTSTTPIPLTNGRPSANARHIMPQGRQLSSMSSSGSQQIVDQGSSSSGNVSFSFTHLEAPSPSSFPLKDSILATKPSASKPSSLTSPVGDVVEARKAAGWTIVSHDEATANRLARERRNRDASGKGLTLGDDGEPDVHLHEDDYDETPRRETDDTGELVLGDLELDDRPQPPSRRVRVGSEAITLYVEDIVKDPLYRVRQAVEFRNTAGASLSPPNTATFNNNEGSASLSQSRIAQNKEKLDRNRERMEDALLKEDIDLPNLRKLAWSGIPAYLRPVVWPLLLGYFPLSQSARLPALARKRQEYQTLVDLTFSKGRDGLDQQIWHQIEIDVPRTRPGINLWMMEGTQRSLERILYVWAIRHPASGYVQGINDLVTPFYEIFLSAYIDSDPEDFDPSFLPPHILMAVEADSFWCLSRLLDGIQENYIHSQPGIQRSVKRMRELVGRIDPGLAAHLDAQGVEFIQFAFRWMNCLLMREISVKNTIRMWDTYLSEGGDAFSRFHLYVCCAFLLRWRDVLRTLDFQGTIMFLQSLPTEQWGDYEMEMLLSEAFVLSNTWANAQSHFS